MQLLRDIFRILWHFYFIHVWLTSIKSYTIKVHRYTD